VHQGLRLLGRNAEPQDGSKSLSAQDAVDNQGLAQACGDNRAVPPCDSGEFSQSIRAL